MKHDFKQLMQLSVASCAVALAATAQAQAITISVDANANRKAINPLIYGIAFPNAAADIGTLNTPLNRWGGNGVSRYNWQINASNHASDWYFESIASASSTAAADADQFINDSRNNGATPAMTIGELAWTAKVGSGRATLGSFSIAKYGPQTGSEGDHGNGISTASGNPYITGNDPNDANTANSTSTQLGWVQHMKSTFGSASAGGVKYYLMDNESGLWQSTHRDVHPTGPHGTEIAGDIETYAAMIKGQDSGALIQGPEEWGWTGFEYDGYDSQYGGLHGWTNLPDFTNVQGGVWYLPWLLQTLKSYDTAHGTKSIDVFSLHWYPQSGEYSNDDSAGQQANRNKSTRSLWDPNYVDISWIGTQVQLIPRMKGWVSSYYPGLQTAITEYSWGDEANMNGATAQADVFGIFGREGLDLATRWTTPANNTPTFMAMKLYRNYDGTKKTFGDTSVSCTVPNADQQSAFAAQRTSDNALTVVAINKITSATAATISLANFAAGTTAQRYQVTGASITHLSDITVTGGNSISDTLPAQSITLYVIAKSAGGAPPVPTGLSAAAGNGQVALSWNVSSGATAYDVKRSTVSGSGYATVSSPTTNSYTNTGLTNGTTYYFVVDAKSAGGTSANSTQVSATPSSGDTAQYNFETSTQSWVVNGAPITGISSSTTQHYAGTHSLAVTINGAAGSNQVYIGSPTTAAGKVVTFHVWIPSGSQITSIQPFVQQGAGGGWLWTGSFVAIGSLATNAWNTVTVTVPSNAVTPLYQMGVQFTTGATWSGTCYVDSISWP